MSRPRIVQKESEHATLRISIQSVVGWTGNVKSKEWFSKAERFVRSYTNGIVETLDGSGENFGFERLRDGLAPGGSSRVVHDRVVLELDRFRGEERVYDDRSLVVMTRRSC